MSDIIYTPPASGGGGTTINPTNDFIPVRFNATSFKDSFLRNTTTALESQYIGVKKGIYLNFANQLYSLGDYNLATNGTMLVVDENNETISTKNINEPKGLLFDYNGAVYKFGDFNNYNNGSSLIINDTTQNIYTSYNGFGLGISLDFVNSTYSLGVSGSNSLFIDASNQYVSINVGGSQYLLLDKLNESATFFDYAAGNGIEFSSPSKTFYSIIGNENILYANYGSGFIQLGKGTLQLTCDYLTGIMRMGDATGVGNSNELTIDDINKEIIIYTNGGIIKNDCDTLEFNGASLQSNTSGGNSGEHLVITLNGNQYKIKLEFP